MRWYQWRNKNVKSGRYLTVWLQDDNIHTHKKKIENKINIP